MITYARSRRLSLFMALLFVSVLASAPAFAQAGKTELRIVHGEVVDKNDNPAPKSVVYLMNAKTQAVKTYFTDDKGEYHFTGLDPNVDYEVHAEKENAASNVHKISSFDSRRDIDITLKLSREKGGS